MASNTPAQPLTLAGKVAIVTGASRGIGVAVALELAGRGARVALTYTSPTSAELAEAAVTKINGIGNGAAAIKVQADLRLLDAPEKIVSETRAAFGDAVDILVNNAGVEVTKMIGDITPEDYHFCMDLNVRGALFMTQAALPYLKDHGRVINMSSIGARVGLQAGSVYLTSKAALEGMTRALAAELGPRGITVNAIQPGITESDMMGRIPEEFVEQQRTMTPLEQRIGKPEDIARITAMVAEPQSAWMTGQCISASGGFLMF